jgi:glutamate synthase domain-containing protein 1
VWNSWNLFKTKKFEKNLGKMLSGMLNNMESRGPDSAGFAIIKMKMKKTINILCV